MTTALQHLTRARGGPLKLKLNQLVVSNAFTVPRMTYSRPENVKRQKHWIFILLSGVRPFVQFSFMLPQLWVLVVQIDARQVETPLLPYLEEQALITSLLFVHSPWQSLDTH